MSRIYKSVSLRDTPLVLSHADPVADELPEAAEPDAQTTADGEEGMIKAVLAEADAEAANIFAEAHDRAAAIIVEAQEKADALFREASEAGRQEGYETGLAAGKTAGLAQAGFQAG